MLGRVLLGRYRIMAALAQGGMGVVYLARMEGSAGFLKPVVIKLILPGHSDDPDFVGMFEREARILSLLRDAGIVNVLEFSRDGDVYVMVLEYVRGYHLGQWLSYLRAKKQPMPAALAMQVMVDVLDSLHHAHTACHADGAPMNIVHRDISPSNILLDSVGRARLLDFGVARMRGDEVYKTQVKGFRGKLSYSAPELFSGSEASPQSDVYACAMVLHELLYGRNAFRGCTDQETLHNLLTKPVPSVAQGRDDVPEAMDVLFTRALAKDPAQRYPSAAALAAALRAQLVTSTHHLRQELAHFVREEVLEDLARVLNIESLVARDRAWQRSSGVFERAALAKGLADGNAEDAGTQAGLGDVQGAGTEGAQGAAAESRVESTCLGLGSSAPAGGWPQRGSEPAAKAGLGWPRALVPQLSTGVSAGQAAPLASVWGGATQSFWVGLGICVIGLFSLLGGLLAWMAGDRSPTFVRVVELPDRVEQGPVSPAEASGEGAEQRVPHLTTMTKMAAGAAVRGGSAAPEPREQSRAKARSNGNVLAATERRAVRPPARRSSAAALTRAFRKQQSGIHACFVEYAEDIPETPTLEVGFALDAKGQLLNAELRPKPVQDLPLGTCILKVARRTEFPSFGRPLEFRIPVTARRVR